MRELGDEVLALFAQGLMTCDHSLAMRRRPPWTARRIIVAADPRELMHKAIDSPQGRGFYGRRIATVEPVFANIRYHKGMGRFTLRGKAKVSTQWNLLCLVHHIEKIAHCG